jgi:hypothetical protein
LYFDGQTLGHMVKASVVCEKNQGAIERLERVMDSSEAWSSDAESSHEQGAVDRPEDALMMALASSDSLWAQEALDAGADVSEGYMFFKWWSGAGHERTHPARSTAMARWLDQKGEPLGFFEGKDGNESKLGQARRLLAGDPKQRRLARLATAEQWLSMDEYRNWSEKAMQAVMRAAQSWEKDPEVQARVSPNELMDAMAQALGRDGIGGIQALGLASKVYNLDIGEKRWSQVGAGMLKNTGLDLISKLVECLDAMTDEKIHGHVAGLMLGRACFSRNASCLKKVVRLCDGPIDWLLPEGALTSGSEESESGGYRVSAWHAARMGAQAEGASSDKTCEREWSSALLSIPESLAAALDNPNPDVMACMTISELRELAKTHPRLLAPDQDGRVVAHGWTKLQPSEALDRCARLLDMPDKLEGVTVSGQELELASLVGLPDQTGESARSILSAYPSHIGGSSARERFEKAWAKWERRELARAGTRAKKLSPQGKRL